MAYPKQAIPRLENAIPSPSVLSLIGGIRGRWPMVDLTRVYGICLLTCRTVHFTWVRCGDCDCGNARG